MSGVILQRAVLTQIRDDFKKLSNKITKTQPEGYFKAVLKDLAPLKIFMRSF